MRCLWSQYFGMFPLALTVLNRDYTRARGYSYSLVKDCFLQGGSIPNNKLLLVRLAVRRASCWLAPTVAASLHCGTLRFCADPLGCRVGNLQYLFGVIYIPVLIPKVNL